MSRPRRIYNLIRYLLGLSSGPVLPPAKSLHPSAPVQSHAGRLESPNKPVRKRKRKRTLASCKLLQRSSRALAAYAPPYTSSHRKQLKSPVILDSNYVSEDLLMDLGCCLENVHPNVAPEPLRAVLRPDALLYALR